MLRRGNRPRPGVLPSFTVEDRPGPTYAPTSTETAPSVGATVTADGFAREDCVTTMTPRPAQVTCDKTPPSSGAPIFAALAAHWKAQGRVVPGQVDQEWVKLADSYPWPSS